MIRSESILLCLFKQLLLISISCVKTEADEASKQEPLITKKGFIVGEGSQVLLEIATLLKVVLVNLNLWQEMFVVYSSHAVGECFPPSVILIRT